MKKRCHNEIDPTNRDQAQVAFTDYVRELTQGPVVVVADRFNLSEIREALAPREIAKISAAAFWQPMLCGKDESNHGKLYTHAADDKLFALYWQVGMYEHFCRPLTLHETREFRAHVRNSPALRFTPDRPIERAKSQA